jgi:hypothetical protein
MFDYARLEDGSIVERLRQSDTLSQLRQIYAGGAKKTAAAVVAGIFGAAAVRPTAAGTALGGRRGLGFFAVVAVSTALLQAPQHQALSGGFDRGAYKFLLSTNWIRTAAWSAYRILDLWMIGRWREGLRLRRKTEAKRPLVKDALHVSVTSSVPRIMASRRASKSRPRGPTALPRSS